MGEAIRIKKVSNWQSKAADLRSAHAERNKFADKKFSDLSSEDKDELLRMMAVRLGILRG